MKKWLLIVYLLIGGFLFTACSNRDLKVCHIGVSQCSDDEWRHKMNSEMLREALFYDGLEVEIRSAKDNNQKQIADIQYFIDTSVHKLYKFPIVFNIFNFCSAFT